MIGAFKNRALIYKTIFDELKAEFGAEKATEVMQRAIYKRGRQIGAQFAQYGPSDIAGLKDAFLAGIPDDGKLFGPEVERCDADGLDIKFHRCPLKETWLEAGLPEEEVAQLCKVAAIIDNGTFEAAGFQFHADTYTPGGDGCCHLHIRPGISGN